MGREETPDLVLFCQEPCSPPLGGLRRALTLPAQQDILENESITLDWMFRYSLTNDIVKVGPGAPRG